MATEKERKELLDSERHLAAWQACLALRDAMDATDRGAGLPVAQLMKAAFSAGKAIALFQARS